MRRLGTSWLRLLRAACLLGGLLVLGIAGCRYPEAQPINMELITTLRTALSARNTDWLQANADIVEKRRTEGQMNDAEYDAFRQIIEQARGGDWDAAERASLEFQRAQRPTPEQIEAVRQRRSD
ncbi:MAG: hypothetical protein AB7O59_12830 [Pirellulales bacterium]